MLDYLHEYLEGTETPVKTEQSEIENICKKILLIHGFSFTHTVISQKLHKGADTIKTAFRHLVSSEIGSVEEAKKGKGLLYSKVSG